MCVSVFKHTIEGKGCCSERTKLQQINIDFLNQMQTELISVWAVNFGSVIAQTILTTEKAERRSELESSSASQLAVAVETISKGAFRKAKPGAKPQKNLPLLQRVNSGQVSIHSLRVNPAPPTTPLFQSSHYVPFSLTPLHTHTQLQHSPLPCASMCGWSESMFMKSKARIS